MPAKTPPPTDEQKIFVLHDHVVTTVTGETIPVPRCSWGTEQQVIDLLKDLIKAVVDSGLLAGETTMAQATGFLLSSVFETAPAKLEQAVCVLLKKDAAWVRENLESEEMLQLVLPFLYSKRQTIGTVLAPYLTNLSGLIQS